MPIQTESQTIETEKMVQSHFRGTRSEHAAQDSIDILLQLNSARVSKIELFNCSVQFE